MRRVLRQCVGLAVALAAASGPAAAQSYDGAGIIRFGIFGQYGQTSFDISRQGFAGSTSPTGGGGGISMGYDYRFAPQWIAGIEADTAWGQADSTADGQRGFSSEFMSTARLRLGVQPSRTWLLYGTGGMAVLGTEYRVGPAATSLSGANKLSETRFGWTVGGGTEVDLEGWTVFAEYLHAEFDRWSFTAIDQPARYSIDTSSDVLRLGVRFKLGYDYDHDIYSRRARRY